MRTLRFQASKSSGGVSALFHDAEEANALLVLGHGAGAGMRHAFLEAAAVAFARHGVSTLRYQFPYMEAGRRRPDSAPICRATVRSAVATARELAPDLPLFAGGKSFGGRMASQAQADEPLPRVAGLVFLGFPLHPAGKPGTSRADHLKDIAVPMLFLQGTRDRLATPELLEPICAGSPQTTLHWVDGADHGFGVLKRSGRTDGDVLEELAATAAVWMAREAVR